MISPKDRPEGHPLGCLSFVAIIILAILLGSGCTPDPVGDFGNDPYVRNITQLNDGSWKAEVQTFTRGWQWVWAPTYEGLKIEIAKAKKI